MQLLIIARMMPWISAQPFGVSYWAFTFGLTAMAFDAMKFVQRGMGGAALDLAYVCFAIANVCVAAIAAGTVLSMVRDRMVPELAPAPIR